MESLGNQIPTSWQTSPRQETTLSMSQHVHGMSPKKMPVSEDSKGLLVSTGTLSQIWQQGLEVEVGVSLVSLLDASRYILLISWMCPLQQVM